MKRAERVRERVREAGERVKRRIPPHESIWRDVGMLTFIAAVTLFLVLVFPLPFFREWVVGNWGEALGLDP